LAYNVLKKENGQKREIERERDRERERERECHEADVTINDNIYGVR